MNKNIAKKPYVDRNHPLELFYLFCPNCDAYLTPLRQKWDYKDMPKNCPECNQLLDWSVEE